MIFTLLLVLFWILCVPFAALVAIPWTLISGDSNFLYNAGIVLLRGGMRVAGIRVRLVGRERLDLARTYIFMSNHVSNLDPPVLLPAIPGRSSVLVKQELFRLPIVGCAMKKARLVPIDRANRDAAFASLRAAADVLRSGLHLMVFPEGTRSRDGHLLPFKKGPFHIAMDTGIHVVPVTLQGTREAWPKGRFAIRPREVTVLFHPPLDPAQFPTREALIAAVRQAMECAHSTTIHDSLG